MIRTRTCYELVCDRGCAEGGWEGREGIPHFDTEAEAIGYARGAGFVIAGDTVMCEGCAAEADCDRTGHQWDPWADREQEGVPYRHRWCGHCGASDYDPPFPALRVLLEAARILNKDGGLR